MGIEAPSEYGGVGLNFTAACLAVEEIARVDPAVVVILLRFLSLPSLPVPVPVPVPESEPEPVSMPVSVCTYVFVSHGR